MSTSTPYTQRFERGYPQDIAQTQPIRCRSPDQSVPDPLPWLL